MGEDPSQIFALFVPNPRKKHACRGLGSAGFFAGARPPVSAAKTTPKSYLSGGAVSKRVKELMKLNISYRAGAVLL